MPHTLRALPEDLAVCRLPAGVAIPAWAWIGPVCGAIRAPGETSIVTAASAVPADLAAPVEAGWRALVVAGPLDFALTGILAGLAGALAAAGVSLFALSTFDTDILLVKQARFADAVAALRAAGHTVTEGPA